MAKAMKRVQLDFEHLFYVEKLENRTIKVRKESNIGKPTKSLTPALMSRQIALTNSSGFWYKVDPLQTKTCEARMPISDYKSSSNNVNTPSYLLTSS